MKIRNVNPNFQHSYLEIEEDENVPIFAIAKIGTKEEPCGEGPKERLQSRIYSSERYRTGELERSERSFKDGRNRTLNKTEEQAKTLLRLPDPNLPDPNLPAFDQLIHADQGTAVGLL